MRADRGRDLGNIRAGQSGVSRSSTGSTAPCASRRRSRTSTRSSTSTGAPLAAPTGSSTSRWRRRSRRSTTPASTSREDGDRIGCSVGTGIGGLHTQEIAHRKLFEAGPDRLNPYWVTALIPNMGAAEISMAARHARTADDRVHRVRSVGDVAGERDDLHPRRHGGRDAGRRRRVADRRARPGRVRHDAGAVAPQRRPRGGEPAVRRAARRVRAGRGRRGARARGARAGGRPRRLDLRRGARLRHERPTPTT